MHRIIRRVLTNPWLIPLAISHRYHRYINPTKSVSVMEKDWDNLIVLDSCRFDLFDSCWSGKGVLSSVNSLGSNTSEWLNRNFTEEYPDTVYVIGNPQVQANDIQKRFHEHVNVWQSFWDEELKTIKPSDMADATIEAVQKYNDKRIIAHWIQPHYPFIGKTGRSIEHRTFTGDGIHTETDKTLSIWEQLEQGILDKDKVWTAYKENLELVLPEVERVIEILDGLTVVTSDHGNVFGKYGLYGHPGNKYLKQLVEVPWLVVGDERRKVAPGGIVGGEGGTSVEAEERLEDLGYL